MYFSVVHFHMVQNFVLYYTSKTRLEHKISKKQTQKQKSKIQTNQNQKANKQTNKQNKTKQNKTKQNKNKTKQNVTKCCIPFRLIKNSKRKRKLKLYSLELEDVCSIEGHKEITF